jgi:D-glycero-D-manno-heptose 1,7-bisphosphate phosphatase
VMVGDIRADVAAAEACGATGILVPNQVTRRDEVTSARHVFGTLPEAVDALLGGAW